MRESRRRGVLSLMKVAFLFAAIAPAAANAQQMKVTLLGTGCPSPVMNRFGPSTLVEAGDQKLIFDAGRGALNASRNSRYSGRLYREFSSPICIPIMWLAFPICG
jgi:hypothetical protein